MNLPKLNMFLRMQLLKHLRELELRTRNLHITRKWCRWHYDREKRHTYCSADDKLTTCWHSMRRVA